MGIFDSLSKFITPLFTAGGTAIGGPIGGAIGTALGGVASGAISSGIEGAPAYFSARATNAANQDMSRETSAFNANQALLGRTFSAEQSALSFQRNQKAAKTANTFTKSLVQRQMDFQKGMSDTQYQRGMKDMKKAGLNPILAFAQGGASSPPGAGGSGAQASSTPGAGSTATGIQIPKIDEVAAGINSALNIQQFKLARTQAKATVEQTRQETKRSKSQQRNENAQAAQTLDLTKQQARSEKEDADKKEKYGDSWLGNNIQSIMRMLDTIGNSATSARSSAQSRGYLRKVPSNSNRKKFKPWIGVETLPVR